MILEKKQLKEWLNEEIRLYKEIGYKGRIHSFITQCEIGKIVCYMRTLRMDEYYTNNSSNSVLYKAIALYWRRKHNSLGCKLGISIPINTFGKGLLIYHSQGIVVHKDCRCGEYCKLHGMNCIGNNGTDKEGFNTPLLGNNVDIGVGATVIGGIELANSVKIAAGAVVCKSCKNEGAVLIGVPAREK